MQFHQFQVTQRRNTGELVTRLVILPADPTRTDSDHGFWTAKTRVAACYPGAVEIRSLGLTSRQVWEVANN